MLLIIKWCFWYGHRNHSEQLLNRKLVCRSLGDADLKLYGVIANPEVTIAELSAADEFLIIASDGLWETLSSQDAVGLVYDTGKASCKPRLRVNVVAHAS